MKADDFRRMALALPQAIEASHMGHPDFRVGKRIFATLGHPDEGWAMIKLTPEQQRLLVAARPKIFSPVPGGWGRSGSTHVRLAAANRAAVKDALASAWKNVVPKGLIPELEGDGPDMLDAAFARVRACAAEASLPDLQAATSYGTPSLKLAGKFLLRIKDADTLVLRCDLEEKQLLMEMAPAIYFETDHYKGWPAVLIRLSQIDDAELRHRLTRAWLLVAPKRFAAQFQSPAAPAPRKPAPRRRAGSSR
jgi:hypothetical protein